ncbi:hypothetical protein [Paenirhodobacter sp.]|uniref:hypothetical protein n=1 Tax=Paenirhodobacter sp. TaxID=1965326 RepID=UPI003B4181E2
MQSVKPVGRQAASRKYDLLSAMTVFALAGESCDQTRMLRLIALITTRYNWQRDELCVGQREIARMWSVDERTVKRDMARFRTLGWLVQKSRGTRGRISTYGLGIVRILEDTRAHWPRIGEDFVARMAPGEVPEAGTNVVPLHRQGAAPVVPEGQGAWARAAALLAAEQPALYAAWLQELTEVETGEGCLVLCASNSFRQSYIVTHHQQVLIHAVRRADPALHRVEVVC